MAAMATAAKTKKEEEEQIAKDMAEMFAEFNQAKDKEEAAEKTKAALPPMERQRSAPLWDHMLNRRDNGELDPLDLGGRLERREIPYDDAVDEARKYYEKEEAEKAKGAAKLKGGKKRRRRKRKTRKRKRGGNGDENKNPNPNWKKLQKHGLKIGKEKAQEQHAEKMSERIGEMKTHFGDTISENLPKTEEAIKRQKKEQEDLMTRPRTLSEEEEKKIQKNMFGWERSEKNKEKQEAKIVEKHKKQYQKNYLKILANPKSLNYFKLRLKNILKVLSKKGELGTLCPGDYWGQKDTGCSLKIAKKIGQPELRGKPLLDAIVKHYNIDETLKIKKGGRRTKKRRGGNGNDDKEAQKEARRERLRSALKNIENIRQKAKKKDWRSHPKMPEYEEFKERTSPVEFIRQTSPPPMMIKPSTGGRRTKKRKKHRKKRTRKRRKRRKLRRKKRRRTRKKRGGYTVCMEDADCRRANEDDNFATPLFTGKCLEELDELGERRCERVDRRAIVARVANRGRVRHSTAHLRQRAHHPDDSDDE